MRGEMPRILVGLAVHQPDRRFLSTLPDFAREVEREGLAHLDFHWVWDKLLVEAQNEFGEACLAGNYDWLLTIEDDHYDFTPAMLKSLLDSGSMVSGISYRSRHFPFEKIPMEYQKTDERGVRWFHGLEFTSGYHEADLTGFGFTLIHRTILERLEKPLFRLNVESNPGAGPRATDIDFSHRVQQLGEKIIGCFDYLLPHRDLDDEVYKEMVLEGVLAKHSMFTTIRGIMELKKKRRMSHGVV